MNVRPGQVWQDNDPRQGGRRVTVEKVYGGFAHVNSGKARSRIHLGALPKRFTLVDESGVTVRMLADARAEVVLQAKFWRNGDFRYENGRCWHEGLGEAVDALLALESEGA